MITACYIPGYTVPIPGILWSRVARGKRTEETEATISTLQPCTLYSSSPPRRVLAPTTDYMRWSISSGSPQTKRPSAMLRANDQVDRVGRY